MDIVKFDCLSIVMIGASIGFASFGRSFYIVTRAVIVSELKAVGFVLSSCHNCGNVSPFNSRFLRCFYNRAKGLYICAIQIILRNWLESCRHVKPLSWWLFLGIIALVLIHAEVISNRSVSLDCPNYRRRIHPKKLGRFRTNPKLSARISVEIKNNDCSCFRVVCSSNNWNIVPTSGYVVTVSSILSIKLSDKVSFHLFGFCLGKTRVKNDVFKTVPTVLLDGSAEYMLCLIAFAFAPPSSRGGLCDSEIQLSV